MKKVFLIVILIIFLFENCRETGKKHGCSFSIFDIVIAQAFDQLRFLDIFQLPNIHKDEKRRKYKDQRNRAKINTASEHQREDAGQHRVAGIGVGAGRD